MSEAEALRVDLFIAAIAAVYIVAGIMMVRTIRGRFQPPEKERSRFFIWTRRVSFSLAGLGVHGRRQCAARALLGAAGNHLDRDRP